MARVVERVQKPTLVIAHNKTLAAQLCNEFREYFPHNAVEYFVSYYDYYQPEAYLPASDTYIEKDSSINDDIDRLRHAATAALFSRKDVADRRLGVVHLRHGLARHATSGWCCSWPPARSIPARRSSRSWSRSSTPRNDVLLGRGKFRVRGDVIEVQPANMETAYRISLFGDEVESIVHFDPLTGEMPGPARPPGRLPGDALRDGARPGRARPSAGSATSWPAGWPSWRPRARCWRRTGCARRTEYDMEMLREMGFCNGIENYSRILEGRAPGTPPHTLLDYFPDDYLIVVDESHQTVPQIGGMYEGDRSRKQTLVDHGFRLPSALDNRPLRFDEFLDRAPQLLFVSATPGLVRAAPLDPRGRADHPAHRPDRP